MVEYVECSFMDMGAIEDNTFDRGYAIESTCHAPDKQRAFAEIFRILKPGALFWGQEMCLTDKFDPDDSRHRTIKQGLMRHVALRDIATMGEVDRSLEAAGFHVIEGVDRNVKEGPSTPWWSAHGESAGDVEERLLQDSVGPQGGLRKPEADRGATALSGGLRGNVPVPGSDRGRLCRGR